MLRRLLFLLIVVTAALAAQPVRSWVPRSGPRASRPTKCTRGDVWVCVGADCGPQGAYDYCSSSDTWVVGLGVAGTTAITEVNTMPLVSASGVLGLSKLKCPLGVCTLYDDTETIGVTTLALRAGAGQGSTDLQQWKNAANSILARVASTGIFGIGTNSPTADDAGVLIYRATTNLLSNGGSHAIRDESTYSATGVGGYASLDSIPTMSGSGAHSHLTSFQSRPFYTGSTSLDAMQGFSFNPTTNGTGTVAAIYGVRIADAVGTGTVTNQYGIWCDSLTKGGTGNYCIYSTGTQPSYFAGQLQLGTSGLTSTGPLGGSNFYTHSDSNTVALGIGTSAAGGGYYGAFLGHNSGYSLATGNFNTFVGASSGYSTNGNGNNTYIGSYAGYTANAAGNVFIGKEAGYYETGGSKLFIDNSKRSDEADGRVKALLYGVFDAAATNQTLMVNGALSSSVPGGNIPVCKTYTVASTNAAFFIAGTTATVALATLPAKAIVTGVDVKHSAQFSDGAGAMTQVAVSVGSAGGGDTFYTSATNIGEATAVADTTLQSTPLFKRYTAASEALNAVFTATGRNFGDGAATYLTGGSVDVGVCWVVKP